jgi:hypothetical protein
MRINSTIYQREGIICLPPVQMGVVLLLFIYLAVYVSSSLVIPHTHHVADPLTTTACHSDACHITLYHPGMAGGCHHKNHLTKAEEECTLCHVVLVRQMVAETILLVDCEVQIPNLLSQQTQDQPCPGVSVQGSRGPPMPV